MVLFFAHLSKKTSFDLMKTALVGTIVSAMVFMQGLFSSDYLVYGFSQFVFGLFSAMLVGPFCTILANQFPADVRYTCVAICINFSAAIFGGCAPVIMSYLQLGQHYMIFSALYVILSASIALLCRYAFYWENVNGSRNNIFGIRIREDG